MAYTEVSHNVTVTGDVGGSNFDMETDISQLEAPTFTTLDRNPHTAMLHLQWDHKV